MNFVSHRNAGPVLFANLVSEKQTLNSSEFYCALQNSEGDTVTYVVLSLVNLNHISPNSHLLFFRPIFF